MLTSAEVQKMIAAALARAAELDAPISVAVVDDAGYLQGVARTDRAFRISPDIAITKAYTSAMFGRPSFDIGENTPAEVLAARRNIGLYGMSGSGGGIPIRKDGAVVGAIGVGGSLPHDDIEIAEMAIAALRDEGYSL